VRASSECQCSQNLVQTINITRLQDFEGAFAAAAAARNGAQAVVLL
jgi:hypothetical protein